MEMRPEDFKRVQLKSKMIDKHQEEIRKFAAAVAQFAIFNDMELDEALDIATEIVAVALRQTLDNGQYDQFQFEYKTTAENIRRQYESRPNVQ